MTKMVVYKSVGGRELKLHVFEPAGLKATDKRPAILFFFGGGWQGGTPRQFYWQSDYLAKRGMWAASAEYRVKPKVDHVADCILDAKDAVRFVRACKAPSNAWRNETTWVLWRRASQP